MGRPRGGGRDTTSRVRAPSLSALMLVLLAIGTATAAPPAAANRLAATVGLASGCASHTAHRATPPGHCRRARQRELLALRAHATEGRRRQTAPATVTPGRIEGTVTNAAKAGVKGIEVCAYRAQGGPVVEGPEFVCGESETAGVYKLKGVPPGGYVVEFSTPHAVSPDYATQYYDGASSLFGEGFRIVQVSSGVTTGEIDAVLVEGGEITGTVTSAVSSKDLAGADVCAFSADEAGVEACTQTGANGQYQLRGLPVGQYYVEFFWIGEGGYATQYWDNAPWPELADTVSVTANGVHAHIDAAMEPESRIEGTVTAAGTGQPLAESLVYLITSNEELIAIEEVPFTGEYSLDGLSAGTYELFFEGPFLGPYLPQFFDNEPSPELATPVTLAAGETRTGVNAALESPPEELTAPSLSGSGTVGSVLSCTPGTWEGHPAPTITIGWRRDGAPIAGAAGASYTVQAGDAGHTIACRVTAANPAGTQEAASGGLTIATPPAPSPPPSPPAGQVLSTITVVPVASAASRVITSRHLAAVKLHCSGGLCKGTLKLFLRVVVHHHARTIVLATGTFSLSANTSAEALMHLTAAGRARLAHAARRPVPARLTLSLQGGATTTRPVSAR